MSDWAANDYEPTPEEIKDAFSMFGTEPGHGTFVMVPTMERYIWLQEGVFWGYRTELEDGRIEFTWLIPPRPE